jgi:hypothetical protein
MFDNLAFGLEKNWNETCRNTANQSRKAAQDESFLSKDRAKDGRKVKNGNICKCSKT